MDDAKIHTAEELSTASLDNVVAIATGQEPKATAVVEGLATPVLKEGIDISLVSKHKVFAMVPSAPGMAHAVDMIEGYITSSYIDDTGHTMVRVMTEQGAKNVHHSCINPSIEQRTAYTNMVLEVRKLSADGNTAVQAVVKEYNEKVRACEAAFIGEPLAMPEEALKWIEMQKAQAQGQEI